MNEDQFEGSLIMEKLAQIGKDQDFFDAIDSDDFDKVKFLMKEAGIDSDSISIVLNKINQEE